jgi:hypothetical protein
MKDLTALIGKKIKAAYQDDNKVSIKVGYLEGFDANFLFLKTIVGTEALAISKVFRLEVIEVV